MELLTLIRIILRVKVFIQHIRTSVPAIREKKLRISSAAKKKDEF